ncbi:MAG: hypothetical protein OXH20_12645 [bacterium]|nr:hypothetical protein [bacterium]MXZ31705.1 hypothetical protein [Acidimicrobiia bacterium]MYB23707.1 hypothetical protein [Acidimicrobiia bacterium]
MSKPLIAATTVTLAAAIVAFVLLYLAVRDIETAISQPVTVANPVEAVTVVNPIETVTVANPVETVTIANPVETVTVANPVDTVTIANPVDEVKVTNIVETASPRDSSLYGYCFPSETGGYEIHVVAFSGGIEKTVAAGTYAGADTASTIAQEIVAYYQPGFGLDFGTSSEGCHDLEGWGE